METLKDVAIEIAAALNREGLSHAPDAYAKFTHSLPIGLHYHVAHLKRRAAGGFPGL
jgi:hypothetical protein